MSAHDQNFLNSDGCPICLAFAIQSHDRSLLEMLLSQPVNFPDAFVLPAPAIVFKDHKKCIRGRIPPPADLFNLNRSGFCGHELLDCDVHIEFIQEPSAFYLESIIEVAIAHSTSSFNAIGALIQSKKFDLSEPILYHRVIIPPFQIRPIGEAGKLADCFDVEYMRSSSLIWIPGPLRLANLEPVISSFGVLAFENAHISNMLYEDNLLNKEYHLNTLINRSILQGSLDDRWPFNLKCLNLEAQNSLLVTLYRALFSYDNLKADPLNAYINKLEALLSLEWFDVNAPLKWRKLECFDDGSRFVEVETHYLYELFAVFFSFFDRNAADYALPLYRVLVRHGLSSFPAAERLKFVHRSANHSRYFAYGPMPLDCGLWPSHPMLVQMFVSNSAPIPEYVVPRAEAFVRQLFALGYARPDSDADGGVGAAARAEDCGLWRTREYLEKNSTRGEAGAALRRLVAQFDSAGPLALKSLARTAIRRALRGPAFARLASQLPLPRLLRDFVILAEEELQY